jgi:hypothetical protein
MAGRRNITGRSVGVKGQKLNIGLNAVSTFDLVTSAPMRFSEKLRMHFTSSQSSSNDYLSHTSHISQFSQNSNAILVDGNSYDNKFIAKNAQFIAPKEGYVKSIQGYIVASGSSGCEVENITISAWRKTATVGGTATTPMNLIFSQTFTFNTPSNQYVLAIDSSSGTYNKITMNEKEGVIFSIKRGAEDEACGTYTASLTMVFETTNNQATTGEFMLPSLSQSDNRIDETLCSPDPEFIQPDTGVKVISE